MKLALSSSLFLAGLLSATTAAAQDADADGIPDSADTYPCDPQLAGAAFAPGQGLFGSLMFEDMWPSQGDLDFNDVVLAYNYRYELAPSGAVVRLVATYDVRALGGTTPLGLGLRLPVAASAVQSVTRTVGGGAATTLTPSTQDANATVVVSPDLREVFGNAVGLINSDPNLDRLQGQRIVVTVDFSGSANLSAVNAPYDVYIFQAADPRHQIHQPQYPGTSVMSTSLFGTLDDGSSAGRYFVDFVGLPFALHTPQLAEYPAELVAISGLFPDILSFASSGGTSNVDYYRTNIQAAAQYRDAQGLAAPTPAALTAITPDASCVNVVRASCSEYAAAGETQSGLYTIDPDGSGGNAPYEVYCDLSSNGGGWQQCYALTNTAAQELSCSADAGWFDNCVAAANAAPNQEVMLSLTDTNGNVVYSAYGSKTNTWTNDFLTSTGSLNGQYNRGTQHANTIILNNGHRLTISGRAAGNQGWGGSWGNGYGVVVQNAPAYAFNNVVSVMTRDNSSPSYNSCRARSLQGFTDAHEVMFSASGGISTNSNATLLSSVAFYGTFRFFVR